MNPAVTSAVLTALGLIATYAGVWLTRRSKREDNRQMAVAQSYNELAALASARLQEIDRLVAERNASRQELFQERSEHDRQRDTWEMRWSRQMERCRRVTEPLVAALKTAMESPKQAAASAEKAVRDVNAHNEEDHGDY